MNPKDQRRGTRLKISKALLTLSLLLAAPFSCDPLPERPPVSFVSFGDWGTGNVNQRIVADRLKNFCEVHPCDFVITLGDNFYDDGVSGTDDPQWEKKFRRFYGRLGILFYAALGSHDMSGNIQAQIDYSKVNPQWQMPSEEYVLSRTDTHGDPLIDFFVINGWNIDGEAEEWLEASLASSRAPWKILVSNRPLISNARRVEEGYEIPRERLLPIICNRVQFILSGHDHFFSHMREEIDGCAVEQIILGTGGANLHEADENDASVVRTGSLFGFGYFSVWRDRLMMTVETTEKEEFYRYEWSLAFFSTGRHPDPSRGRVISWGVREQKQHATPSISTLEASERHGRLASGKKEAN